MAKRVTLTSKGEVWTFEEGKQARYVDRKGVRRLGGFSVIEILQESDLIILTDLTGISYDHRWERIIAWRGSWEMEEV